MAMLVVVVPRGRSLACAAVVGAFAIALSVSAVQAQPAGAVFELIDLRTAASKSWQNADGSITAEIFSGPIHYKDPGGTWKEIDTTVTPAREGGYSVTKNPVKVHLSERADGWQTLEAEGISISFAAVGVPSTTGLAEGSSVTYPDAWTSVDLKYTVLPVGIKEELILKDGRAPAEFRFTVRAGGLRPSAGELGAIEFQEETGAARAVIPPSFLRDSTGRLSRAVTTTWSEEPDGSVAVTLHADEAWLAKASFPVVLDPTLYFYPSVDHFFEEPMGSGYAYWFYGMTFLLMGVWQDYEGGGYAYYLSCVKFDTSSIGTDATVISAKIEMTTPYWPASHTAHLHRILNQWPTSSEPIVQEGPAIEHIWSSPGTHVYELNNQGQEKVKELVQTWVSSPSTNYGVEFHTELGPGYDYMVSYHSSEAGSGKPKLTVNCVIDTNPPHVTIAHPPAGEIHKDASATTIRLDGTAWDDETWITKVEVSTNGGGNWTDVTTSSYDAVAHTWYYDWTIPGSPPYPSFQVCARAYDASKPTARSAQECRSVTVTNVDVIYVDGARPDDSGDGTTWATAKKHVQAGLGAVPAGGEVWVAGDSARPYDEQITLVSGVGLYGGFAGTESYREQRDWATNETILEGGQSGSVVTVPTGATSATTIDGFAIQNGSAALGGGIYCSNASATIANNMIRGNAGTWSAGGLYASGSTLTVAGNVLAGNTGYYGGAVYFATTDGQIANNTIIGNTAGSYYGGGICLYESSPALSNNIVAFNSSGIYNSAGAPTSSHNCVYGNPGGNYVDIPDQTGINGNISLDPKLVSLPGRDVHIQPPSPCIDAGDNAAVQPGSLDMDAQPRIQNGTVDIGADESDGCGWYYLTLTPSPEHGLPGGTVTVTAHVTDWDGQDVPGVTVCFSVSGGTITAINGSPLSPGTTSGCGNTDANGSATAGVTRDTEGPIIVTATVNRPCGTGQTTVVVHVGFDPAPSEWPRFHRDIRLSGTSPGSFGSNPAALTKKWVVQLDGNSNESPLWSSPVVADGVVYVATNTGWVYAIDSAGGTEIASAHLGSPIHGTPCVSEGLIYVGTEGGGPSGQGKLRVLALNATAHTFDQQWEYVCPASETIWGATTVYNGAVYFGTNGSAHYLRTVDLTTHTDRGAAATPYGVLGGVAPGIDADYRLPDDTPDDPRVYITDDSCWVTAAQCRTGAWVWSWSADPVAMYASPMAYQGYLFVGSNANYLYRVKDNGSSAALNGSFPTTDGVNSTPAALNGKVYFGCDNNYIYCVDALTFTQYSSKNLGSQVLGSPAISAATELVLVGSLNGKMWVLDANDLANERWSYDIRGEPGMGNATIRSSPAVVPGRMYIVAGDANNRYLYCFGD